MKTTKINWANKDEVTAYYRDYHKKKRELAKKKTYSQEYYLKNRDKIREKQNERRSKLKDNPFTKKYKEELIRHEDRLGEWYETRQDTSPLNKKVIGSSSLEGGSGGGGVMSIYPVENANQVKSWKRGAISETVNLTYIFLAFIIGFSLCVILVTPLVIMFAY